jgi:hypothetical protein
MRLIRLYALALLLALPVASSAAVRTLPTNIRTGVMEAFDFPYMTVSGKVFRLAPGAKIRDQGNVIVQPVMVRGSGAIAFNFDHQGQLLGIWILTLEEIATLKARGYTFETK